MERSSPIAAMRSQAIPFGTLQWNYALGERISQARNDFGFQDFRSNSTYGDYLTSRPSRATSPTSNLAADLSRNFHLDSR